MAKKKFQWVAGEDNEDPRDAFPGRGRSRRKREAEAMEGVVTGLLALQDGAWRSLPLSETIMTALGEARRLEGRGKSAIALRRQGRYIAGLLRHEDEETLEVIKARIEEG